MALGANSYGDTAEIAELVPRHATPVGTFDATTRPSLTQLESNVDQLSAMLNTMLAEAGFDIPVTQADAKLTLDLFVNQEAAALVEGINGYGRFGPTQGKGTPRGRFALMMDDVQAFIIANMAGFERLGAARDYSQVGGLGYRGTDESGNEIFPMFQRDSHGDNWPNWDSD
jgi:hypothetical protein